MDTAALTAHAEGLLQQAGQETKSAELGFGLTNLVYQGTITLMQSLYGADSPQERALRGAVEDARQRNATPTLQMSWARASIMGALGNILSELRGGIVGNLRKGIAGEVLTDFVGLARAILQNRGEQGKDVAAVLAAAAFEDTIRRMGAAFAGVVGRDDLQDVVNALKSAGVLVAPQLGIAQSYLSFRNHALHAEWNKIEPAAVHSVLGFVEQILLKHFG